MRFPATAIAIILCGSLSTFAQTDLDARAVLQRVVTTIKSASAFHFEVETESETLSDRTRSLNKSREVIIKGNRPDLVRVETTDGSGSFVAVSDGKTLWRANPDLHEFMLTEAKVPVLETQGGGQFGAMGINRARMAMRQFERIGQNLIRAVQIGTETVELNGKQIECAIIRADYDAPMGFDKGIYLTRTYWIDTQRNIPLRENYVIRGFLFPTRPHEVMETRRVSRYVVASVNEPVAETFFTYNPPANFREVDQLALRFRPDGRELLDKVAPMLVSKTLTGETLDLANLRGKIVLLDYWATWCVPCQRQMPAIAKLYEQVRDQGVVVLGVNRDESAETALKYLRDNKYEWPSLHDDKLPPSKPATIPTFKVEAIPTLILIDREGIVRDYQVGAGEASEQAIRASLRKLKVQIP